MILAEKFNRNIDSEVSPKKGFFVGLFQALALIPGMSRSGMTIAGGLFLNIKRDVATRFSFILALPVLFGSGFKKLIDLNSLDNFSDIKLELIFGAATSFLVGYFVIHFLIKYLQKHSLKVFAYYRFVLAIIILLFLI
jgi:undecaprenyl-diphosphatase